ncbi:hypothetical protein V493_05328 [Pseudogymnoascus sp. VKM F-4281 (FW-2241)]|nr:hypothetical protein V493_05328 [Pseudogymnoascus sp. VKM F-4281 (FW-2241)]
MWKPPVSFITLHYAWIIFAGLLGLIVIYPYGNVRAVDAYFFGASASTESGLNTVDVKDLKTYQQIAIYFIPIFTNLGFVNIIVVAVRLHWFNKHLGTLAPSLLSRLNPRTAAWSSRRKSDVEAQVTNLEKSTSIGEQPTQRPAEAAEVKVQEVSDSSGSSNVTQIDKADEKADSKGDGHITFAQDVKLPHPSAGSTLHVPPPKERDQGMVFLLDVPRCPIDRVPGVPITETDTIPSDDEEDAIKPIGSETLTRRRTYQHDGLNISLSKSIERVASSMFVLGATSHEEKPRPKQQPDTRPLGLPFLSRETTVGRNSQFHNLTAEDRVKLGGIEYRSLKLLLKITSGYFFGLHTFGVICLLPWIHNAPSKYTDWLQECGQDKTWWAFYSSQTMVDNLGFTLTPDSMSTFKDATWPMLCMTFLAFAGNTFYPVFLRLVIWTMSKLVPTHSTIKEPLQFLLDHPRRCYTLLFPSRPTWILFSILVAMNSIDVLLIIVLDLNNTAVNDLPMGPRILSALFQAASSRHTGTSTLNLAKVNPAVQFSLVVMMYIAIFPIAISIRASNTYEEKTLGVYGREESLNETKGSSYIMTHIRNQLSFDLWYIFLGTFCICIAESDKIMDDNDPAFALFPLFFEVVSAYGNVGLSLGHPSVATSLSGQFTTFSKLIICIVMIRGRHRTLPYALDRAIMLPSERLFPDEDIASVRDSRHNKDKNLGLPMKMHHTS